jgi:DNA-binding transcriptional LysR family regulator
MDTQNLKAFIKVTELSSFSLAAEKLHITQPAVSKRISSLEQQLECKLFDRIGWQIKLTEAGKQLYPRAQQILKAVADAKRSLQDLPGTVAGKLSIGISHHIGLHRLPPVLQAFTRSYPLVHLDIDFMDSEEAHERITQGRLELGVVTLDSNSDTPINNEVIWQDELIVVTSVDHHLLRFRDVGLATLSQFPAILPGLNTYTGQIIKARFEKQGLKLDISMSTNYLETIKMMVSVGLGWSVLPKTMLAEDIREVSVPDLQLQRPLGYIYHRNRTLSNAASAFVETLRQHRDQVAGKSAG